MKIHVIVYIALLIGLLLLQSGCRPRFETPAVQFTITSKPTAEDGRERRQHQRPYLRPNRQPLNLPNAIQIP